MTKKGEAKLRTDQDKLNALAEWLDIQDVQKGETEIQRDLRRIADKLTKLEKERDEYKRRWQKRATVSQHEIWLQNELQALKGAIKKECEGNTSIGVDILLKLAK